MGGARDEEVNRRQLKVESERTFFPLRRPRSGGASRLCLGPMAPVLPRTCGGELRLVVSPGGDGFASAGSPRPENWRENTSGGEVSQELLLVVG